LSAKRIEFFLSGNFPEGNASNSRIKAYAHALQDAGHQVNLIYLWASAFNNEGINTKAEGRWENIHYKFITNNCKRPKSSLGKLSQSIHSFFAIIGYFITNYKNFDICYLYSPDIIFYWHVILLAKLTGKKIVFEHTEFKSSFRDAKKPMHRFLRFMNQWDESHAQYLCDHLIVISKSLYTHYKDYFPRNRLTLIPIVVDLRRFTNHAIKQKGLIGYIGSFGYKDGVEGIINAFELAHQQNPLLRLRLIGYCENLERIRALVDSRKLTTLVEFTGLVLYNKVPKLLEECELLLMNRIDTKYAHYGSPTKLAEYLASGVPTLATNVGDVKDYLTHRFDTYIIPPEDDNELAETILMCFNEKEIFNTMGKQGRITCEQKFSHENQLQQLVQIMERL
jgi:glycosyltransferase involved in cell wall biosynthesis